MKKYTEPKIKSKKNKFEVVIEKNGKRTYWK